jgi:DNA helicase II / ATP-dependent DNA helicase PcrA
MTSSPHSETVSLDDEQRAAVEATEPAIAVLAGPGSGKTRTLSFRARHLLLNDTDAHALLLTFTNKAASEMKSRALGAATPSNRLSASTFHTFCADVLRAHGDLVGISRDFEIIDTDDIRELAHRAKMQTSLPNFEREWSDARLRREVPEDRIQRFGVAYQALKDADGVVDFDDLVVYVAALFAERDDVVQAYAGRYRHILVDEFQDTNAVQSVIVHALAAHAMSVSIFADDDQAIFGFAGAEAANIARFIATSNARVYPLTINYRSGSAIVDVANKLIAASPTASGRRMRAHHTGGSVELQTFPTLEAEAASISSAIAGMIASNVPTSEIAVLVRSGWRANLIVDALENRGIPVSDWRGETFAPKDRRLLTACLSVIRGNLNARQSAALAKLIGVEPVGATASEVFLNAHASHPLVSGLSAMKDLVFQGATPHKIAQAAQAAVVAHNPELGASLRDIVESVANFELYDREFTLEHLLSELALGSVGRPPTEGGGVKVASLHRTKGLQWRTIFLVGMEESHHPDRRSTSDKDLAEELRLCFVGVSRAERGLRVTWSRTSGDYGRAPSRFLQDMGLVP